MKKEFEMTADEFNRLKEIASQPVMFLSWGKPMFDHQDEANRVWKEMGAKYGFVWDSGEPIPGKSATFFKATPKIIE